MYTSAVIKFLTSITLLDLNNGRDSEVVILCTRYSQKNEFINLKTIYFVTKQRTTQVKIGVLLREIVSKSIHARIS